MAYSIPLFSAGLETFYKLAALLPHHVIHSAQPSYLDPWPPYLSYSMLKMVKSLPTNACAMTNPGLSCFDGESLDEGHSEPTNVATQAGLGRRQPGHDWTREERKVLCIARLWFKSNGNTDKLTFRAIKQLLAACFADTIGGPSFQQMSTSAVASQCYEVVRIRKDPWDKITSQSRKQLEGHIAYLKQVINENSLDLVERESKFVPSPQSPMTIRHGKHRESSNDNDYEQFDRQRRPRRSHTKVFIPAKRSGGGLLEHSPLSPLTSPLAKKSQFQNLEEVDELLLPSASAEANSSHYKYVLKPGKGGICYRFFDDASQVRLGTNGFVARGAVDDQNRVRPPMEPFSPEFRAVAKDHLMIRHSAGGSPFISIVRSFASPPLFY